MDTRTGVNRYNCKTHGIEPRTHKRSKDIPIDCVFGSVSFQISKGGFLSFGKLMSNHQGGGYIPKFLLYGYIPPQPHFCHAKRLKITDPRVVENYLTYLHIAKQDHDLFQSMENIHKVAIYPLIERIFDRYEEIDVVVGKLMDDSEEQCQNLHTGSIPSSPAYKKVCMELEYWLNRRLYIKMSIITSENCLYFKNYI